MPTPTPHAESPFDQRWHPDFDVFAESWRLALAADGYSARTLASYGRALDNHAGWLHDEHPDVGPVDVARDHVRGWLVALRDSHSQNTRRTWFSGVRHFYRWLAAEGERAGDPTEGIKTPKPGEVHTPVRPLEEIRALLATCAGRDLVARRDAAIIMLFLDGGLRLAELAGLDVDDVDLRDRIVYVAGKGRNRSGPRHRAVPIGVRCAQALDRYLRERRRHPFREQPQLWLGDRNRATLSADGIDAMLKRRSARAGIGSVHPHLFRHLWASQFRAAGGSEGDLMVLGGWRSRTMLDRYGAAAADERAREAYRRLALGDRL